MHRACHRYGYRAIYLATDSASAVEEARRRYPEYTWIAQPIDRSRYELFARNSSAGLTIEHALWGASGWGGWRRGAAAQRTSVASLAPRFSPAVEFDEFMADMYLMARADGFVGDFTSNLDRLAYALSAAYASDSGTCLKPFISLGGYWCFDHNVRSGRTARGELFWC